MGSGWGVAFTIAQERSQLVLESPYFTAYDMQPALRYVLALDGTESRASIRLGRGDQDLSSRTNWVGDTLVIVTLYPFRHPDDGRPLTSEVRRRLWLEGPDALVVHTIFGGSLGGPATENRSVYRRR